MIVILCMMFVAIMLVDIVCLISAFIMSEAYLKSSRLYKIKYKLTGRG